MKLFYSISWSDCCHEAIPLSSHEGNLPKTHQEDFTYIMKSFISFIILHTLWSYSTKAMANPYSTHGYYTTLVMNESIHHEVIPLYVMSYSTQSITFLHSHHENISYSICTHETIQFIHYLTAVLFWGLFSCQLWFHLVISELYIVHIRYTYMYYWINW